LVVKADNSALHSPERDLEANGGQGGEPQKLTTFVFRKQKESEKGRKEGRKSSFSAFFLSFFFLLFILESSGLCRIDACKLKGMVKNWS